MGSCMSSNAAANEHGGTSSSSSNPNGNARDMRNRSYQIDKMLEQDSKQFRKECKILLLGPFHISSAVLDCAHTGLV